MGIFDYFQGLDVARSKLNFMLLAEGQRGLFDETTETSQEVVKQSKPLDNVITETARNKDVIGMLLTGYENLRAENQRLKEMAEGSNEMKFIDEYKKEIKELRSRLLEVSNMPRGGIQNKLTVQVII